MPLVGITRSGLLAIAGAVFLLWTCVVGEHSAMQRAYADREAVMKTLRQNRSTVPVAVPRSLPMRHPERPVAG